MHNPASNQLDANFGFTAGVAECLLQSHAGEIFLLPALPVSKEVSVAGLKAVRFRGEYELKDGKLSACEILSIL